MRKVSKKLATKIAKYVAANPIEAYADYRDELPDDTVNALLDGNVDAFNETAMEYEISYQDNSYTYDLDAMFDKVVSEFDIDADKYDREDIEEIIRDNMSYDFGDYWKTCARNTSARVTITLLDANGETFDAPYSNYRSDEEDEINCKRLMDTFGLKREDCDKIECVYDAEVLKLCGSVDLSELLDGKKLTGKVTVGPDDKDNLLFHDSFNGSGSMGSFNITKEVTLTCKVRLDKSIKYGVDDVYGFTGSYWSHNVRLETETTQ